MGSMDLEEWEEEGEAKELLPRGIMYVPPRTGRHQLVLRTEESLAYQAVKDEERVCCEEHADQRAMENVEEVLWMEAERGQGSARELIGDNGTS
eukprot:g38026.t1